MLLTAAAKADLVNYGFEWWYYSYGDRAWAYVMGANKAIYGLAHDAESQDTAPSEKFFLQAMREELFSWK